MAQTIADKGRGVWQDGRHSQNRDMAAHRARAKPPGKKGHIAGGVSLDTAEQAILPRDSKQAYMAAIFSQVNKIYE
ncbi:hypothetical protein [Paracoccus sp. Ld10]|uniref:hypothetical protein n=1 Tax=Paracoccus sp. Ld10 TaxID=649158 RepID=UPI0038678EDC